MTSAESIKRIFLPALIAIREASPFATTCSCGEVPIKVTIRLPAPKNAALCGDLLTPQTSERIFFRLRHLNLQSTKTAATSKSESNHGCALKCSAEALGEGFHLQRPTPTTMLWGHCHEGLCALLHIARVEQVT